HATARLVVEGGEQPAGGLDERPLRLEHRGVRRRAERGRVDPVVGGERGVGVRVLRQRPDRQGHCFPANSSRSLYLRTLRSVSLRGSESTTSSCSGVLNFVSPWAWRCATISSKVIASPPSGGSTTAHTRSPRSRS